MNEIKKIIELYDKVSQDQSKAVLATVVKVHGSAYRRPGARMLMTSNGNWVGTISGGCLEGDALRKAKQCMLNAKPMVITYDTRDDSSNKMGANLGCNGLIDVFMEPLTLESKAINDLKSYLEITEPTAVGLIYSDSSKKLTGKRVDAASINALDEPSIVRSELNQGLAKAFEARRSMTKELFLGERILEVFFEYLKPNPKLIIFGSGLDAYPIIKYAKILGWDVTVTSDSYSITYRENFVDADNVIFIDRDDILNHLEITPNTYCVLISHNYSYDLHVIKALIKTKTPYIGILGPRKRFEKIIGSLNDLGFELDALSISRIHSPIGLDIGGDTPEEIGLSIVSEVQSLIYGKQGSPLRLKQSPIHDRDAN